MMIRSGKIARFFSINCCEPETTASTIKSSVTEEKKRTDGFTASTNVLNRNWMMSPAAIGSATISSIFAIIGRYAIGTIWPTVTFKSTGVTTGLINVSTTVIITLNKTVPFAINVYTLAEVALGTLPDKMKQVNRSG